jgi:putative membrane protein
MSDTPRRAPRSFSLEPASEKDVVAEPKPKKTVSAKSSAKTKTKAPKRKPKTVSSKVEIEILPDEAAQRVDVNDDVIAEQLTPPPPVAGRSRKRFRWSRVFWFALSGLVTLAVGLWVDQLIRDLFARTDWLGWAAVVLAVLIAVAAVALALREFIALRRMTKIDEMRRRAVEAVESDDAKSANKLVVELDNLYSGRPDTARGRALLAEHQGEILDGRDMIHLVERDLIKPLDIKARSLVMGSAKRVSVVTAVSPRAIVDIGFVLFENMKLIRQLAELYGGRPGTLGFWRLARNVVGHLAITGTIAVGDGLIQQVVGQGLASKLSSRLGEGVVNGLLTARIGIAAIDVCRPLPFSDQTRPSVGDFMSELTRFSSKEASQDR